MLLYRPLIRAYQHAVYSPIRRYLLRELAEPLLHADFEETLEELARTRDVSLVSVPERLAAQVQLEERLVGLRLTSGDVARQQGGLWTQLARRAHAEWLQHPLAVPDLSRAAGSLIGATARELLGATSGVPRARALAAIGDLGTTTALGPLADELSAGAMPGPASIGLARLGSADASLVLPRAVKARGLDALGPVLGFALRKLAYAPMLPLLETLLAHPSDEVQEQGCWALGGYPPDVAESLAARVKEGADPFVRVTLLTSLGRLGAPGGLARLEKLVKPGDSELVHLSLIRAAGWSRDPLAHEHLARMLRAGTAEQRAQALESLLVSGVPGGPFLAGARSAATSECERLALHGMLALVLWSPGDAYGELKKVFAEPASWRWYCATYALRYLISPRSARLLRRVRDVVAGSDLEDVVVDALGRHLELPGVLESLLDVLAGEPRPPIVSRIASDLARHLPASRAEEAADGLRKLLRARPPPRTPGPLLEALGALGTPEDLETLVGLLDGPAAVHAVRGLELLMNETATGPLESLIQRAPPDVRDAAILALFRMGDTAAADHVCRLAADGEPAAATRLLSEMSVTVRNVPSVPRLALLHSRLATAARESARPAPGAPAAELVPMESPVRPPALSLANLGRAMEERSSSLATPGPTPPVSNPDSRPTVMAGSLAAGTGDRVYRALAGHFGKLAGADRRMSEVLLAGLIALVLAAVVASRLW